MRQAKIAYYVIGRLIHETFRREDGWFQQVPKVLVPITLPHTGEDGDRVKDK